MCQTHIFRSFISGHHRRRRRCMWETFIQFQWAVVAHTQSHSRNTSRRLAEIKNKIVYTMHNRADGRMKENLNLYDNVFPFLISDFCYFVGTTFSSYAIRVESAHTYGLARFCLRTEHINSWAAWAVSNLHNFRIFRFPIGQSIREYQLVLFSGFCSFFLAKL